MLSAPVKKGRKIGELACTLRGQELGRVDLLAGADVPRRGWHRRVWDKVFKSA